MMKLMNNLENLHIICEEYNIKDIKPQKSAVNFNGRKYV